MTLRDKIDEMREHQLRSEDKGLAIITFSVKEFGRLLDFHDKLVASLRIHVHCDMDCLHTNPQPDHYEDCAITQRDNLLALLDEETS